MTTGRAGGVIRYQLGATAAARRARAVVGVGAATSLAPMVFATVLLRKLGWTPPPVLWVLAGMLVALVLVRAFVAYGAAQRRLRLLSVVIDGEEIRVESTRDAYGIERVRVARITEIEGPLGGLRVESQPDPGSGAVTYVHVPRGGDSFGEVRAQLEPWRPIERRGRRGPALRLAVGAVVVAAIFFVPFLLEDFVARSKLLAAGLVVVVWLVMRGALRRA